LIGTHRHIQQPDHVEPVQQLGDRDHPAVARQVRIRRTDPHPPPTPDHVIAYPAHQMGARFLLDNRPSTTESSQVATAPIANKQRVSPAYSRNRV
jgi:hypothetical protein